MERATGEAHAVSARMRVSRAAPRRASAVCAGNAGVLAPWERRQPPAASPASAGSSTAVKRVRLPLLLVFLCLIVCDDSKKAFTCFARLSSFADKAGRGLALIWACLGPGMKGLGAPRLLRVWG